MCQIKITLFPNLGISLTIAVGKEELWKLEEVERTEDQVSNQPKETQDILEFENSVCSVKLSPEWRIFNFILYR